MMTNHAFIREYKSIKSQVLYRVLLKEEYGKKGENMMITSVHRQYRYENILKLQKVLFLCCFIILSSLVISCQYIAT